jgi:predicted P-loop ATPase
VLTCGIIPVAIDPARVELANLDRELNGWRSDLLLGAHKQPKPVVENALIALRGCPEWDGVLAYDEFAVTTMAQHPPPWLQRLHNKWEPRRWTDDDDVRTTAWLQRNDICINSLRSVAAAVLTVARERSYHPIQDYLEGIEWDGGDRVEGFAANLLGAARTPYHEAVSRVLFISGVARIMQPGCKADCVPVLEGAQGIGKSTALKTLFSPWFSDDLADLGTKDASMQVRAAWCIELAELSAMSAAETEKIKSFISRSVDRFRPSYGRHVIEAPRQSVLIGTTNADIYLKDEIGGRRFLPIQCGRIDISAIERCKSQLWAEAVALYQQGCKWWLADDAAAAAAVEEQDSRYLADVWEDKIANFVTTQPDVSVAEVLEGCLGIEPGRWQRSDQMRVGRCLTHLKLIRYQKRDGEKREWRYRYRDPTKVSPP